MADPQNPVLCPLHLHAAAREKPLLAEELLCPEARATLKERNGRFFTPKRNPHREITLRGLGATFTLRGPDGEVLGYLDERQAYWEAHPGAIYLHQGESYLVRNVDLARREVWLLPALEDYYTEPRAETDLEVLSGEEVGPGVWVGRVVLRERVVGYVKKRFYTGSVLEEVPLEMPEVSFPTEALWFHPRGRPRLPDPRRDPRPGARHDRPLAPLRPGGAAGRGRDLLPLLPQAPSLPGRAHGLHLRRLPRGVGYARRAARRFPEWLKATLDLLRSCPCEEGCPRCVLSPSAATATSTWTKRRPWPSPWPWPTP